MAPRLLDLAYLAAALVAGPWYLLRRRLRRRPLAPPRERLGFVSRAADGRPALWIHGVSVGEILAGRELVKRLAAARPALRPLVTATTAAGLDVARRTYPGLDVVPSPYDLSFAVARFLDRLRPRSLVLLELELWPNWLWACERRGIPVVVVNGKISERSAAGYRRLGRLLGGFPARGVARFLVQEEVHRARLRALGVEDARIEVAGNLKYDNVTCTDPEPERSRLRALFAYPEDARVLVAGSTHPGEEEALLDAFARMAAVRQQARLVLAPRHPERLPEVLALCRRLGREPALRSAAGTFADPAVLVVDTMGELHTLYRLADAAYVGGTLVPVGGHNLLEPAAVGIPVVVGPHLHTVQDVARALEREGVVHVVPDAARLAPTLEAILGASDAGARARAGARVVIEKNRGAVDRAVEVVLEYWDRVAGPA